jgi:sulfatase modifying factor 1
MVAAGCGGPATYSGGAGSGAGGAGAPNGSGAATGAIVATAGLTSGTVALSGSSGDAPIEAGAVSDGSADSGGGAVVCGVAAAVVICTQAFASHTWCLTNDPATCPGSDPADGYTCQNQCGPGQYGFRACGPFADGGPTIEVPAGCTSVPTPTVPGYACCPSEPVQSTSDASAPEAGTDAGIDAGAPPTCAPGGPGMTNCGPGGSGTESCCTSLEVEGGTYFRTYDLTDEGLANPPADGGPTGEADPATVSSFRLDKYLVTVGRFRQFVNAVLPPDGGAGWLPPAGSGKHVHLNGGQGLVNVGVPVDAGVAYEPGWVATDDGNVAPTDANLTTACLVPEHGGATWTASAGGNENLPITCTNWYEAYAFCIWDGGFLPSEAEWEYAAAGGSQQREYPWGSAAPGTANQYAIYGNYYPSGTQSSAGVANIAPVGTATLGVGLWGQLDLEGDMFEFVLDTYALYVDPCVDCANLGAVYRLTRGDWYGGGDEQPLLPPFRSVTLGGRGSGVGIRCARTP